MSKFEKILGNALANVYERNTKRSAFYLPNSKLLSYVDENGEVKTSLITNELKTKLGKLISSAIFDEIKAKEVTWN